ncbi:hypothetical protein RFI_05898 [Reticulomyxa filosa]|uniref:Uncharacterized protein n=1 Tax=Reticulomyxa filosa TaxID=46433 RepID=X6NY27_RETFI|nr:hypothetical protein RFI_05898 [Reticulomyxa filosa]|eukprot:ETO31225.1 hypothetical protein RFI_05898 [Reticulomyxa filosa]
MWSHSIDLNIIYILLIEAQNSMEIHQFLDGFRLAKDSIKQRYNKIMKEFMEHRCCNHDINLFFIYLEQVLNFLFLKKQYDAVKLALSYVVYNGLPFVQKDKAMARKQTEMKLV